MWKAGLLFGKKFRRRTIRRKRDLFSGDFAVMKKVIVIVLLFCSVFSIFAAGTPVIDVTAITTAIQNFTTTVEQYNRQIKQWQSEYERLKKSAEAISSGDFMTVVSGVASLASQMSGWTSDLGWTETTEWLKKAEDGSYSMAGILTNTNLLLNNLETITDTLEANVEGLKDIEDGWDLGSSGFDMAVDIGDFVTNLLTNGGNMVISGFEMFEDVANMFLMTPDVAVEMYRNILKDTLKKKAGVSSYDELLDKITSVNDEITKAQAELLEIDPTEEARKYKQKENQIEQLEKQMKELKELKDLYIKTEGKIAEMEAAQSEYDELAKAEETAKAETEQNQAEASSTAELNDAVKDLENANVDDVLGVTSSDTSSSGNTNSEGDTNK